MFNNSFIKMYKTLVRHFIDFSLKFSVLWNVEFKYFVKQYVTLTKEK